MSRKNIETESQPSELFKKPDSFDDDLFLKIETTPNPKVPTLEILTDKFEKSIEEEKSSSDKIDEKRSIKEQTQSDIKLLGETTKKEETSKNSIKSINILTYNLTLFYSNFKFLEQKICLENG